MKQCLIVDDSPVIRKVASLIVEQIAYTVLEAETADQALEKCAQRMPDLILLDWQMPGMPTLDFLETLTEKYPDERPQIIYCTTNFDAYDINKTIAAGATDFILKPYDRDSLRAKIAGLNAIAA